MTTNGLQLQRLNQLYLIVQKNEGLERKIAFQEKQIEELGKEVSQLRTWLKAAQEKGLLS